MSKHAPGPWELQVFEETEEWEGECVVIIPGSPQDEVYVRDKANARLIAACPDLYAALADIVRWQDDFDWRTEQEEKAYSATSGNLTYIEALMDQARAALAKARGEE